MVPLRVLIRRAQERTSEAVNWMPRRQLRPLHPGAWLEPLSPTRIAAFSLAQKANSGRSFWASFGVRAEACFCAGGPVLEGVDARLSRGPALLGTMYSE